MTADIEVIARGDTPPEDPDAQHTVTDFLDYTEYLPSDLIRSLTLIGKLDDSYLTAVSQVHELSKDYGALPTLSPRKGSIARAQNLRQDISHNLNHAISCRESSYGEACRLYEMVDRHYNRLMNIQSKLHALPKPPSRDPTPVPRSPQVARHEPTPRITLRLDGARAAAQANRGSPKPQKPRRSRKITVPGEVLPPPNPDSPAPFTDSEWESVPPSPLPMPTSRVGGSRKPPRIRPPKPPKLPKLKAPRPPRPPRPPGAVGTNVHSSVAGISTSNALSLLTPPPPEAKPGSRHAPWMRLTEWEMAKLRKRMKKNAIWTPSETMIRRELSLAGRGPDNYRKARSQAEAAEEEFLDEDDIANAEPGKPLLPGEISADSLGLAETNLENRGMKLNEAKKMKREVLAKQHAAELESEAQKLGVLGTKFKQLFSPKPPEPSLASPVLSTTPTTAKASLKDKSSKKEKAKENAKAPDKKRKRDDTPKQETQAKPREGSIHSEKSSKKRKTEEPQSALPKEPAAPPPLAITTQTTTTTVPLAAPAPSPKKPSRRSTPATPATPIMAAPDKPKPATTSKPTASSSRPRRVSLTLKGPAEPPPEPVQTSPHTATRATSRRSSTAGPLSATTAPEVPHRKSATPAPPTSPAQIVTAAGRRSKRPAPGLVVENQDGGAAISVGKRQHAPAKRAGVNARKVTQDSGVKEKEEVAKDAAVIEEIDPNEPRYCLCGDVSYGEMVACENPNVSFPRA
ncbi:hypothetical protein ACLMJK_008904 [Lecanora helva]